MIPPLSEIRLVAPDHVVARVVDGMTVLLDVDSGRTFSFDDVGTRAWQALTESPNAQDALAKLLALYDASPAVLERDLVAMIERLSGSNLVQVLPR